MPGTISLASNEISVGEVDGSVQVTFKRAGDLTGAVKVSYGVTADTATAGLDFAGGDSFVIIPDGADRAVISVPILDDTLAETTEVFVVSIVTAENVVNDPGLDAPFINAPRTTRVSILDNENPVQDPVDPPAVSNYDVTLQPIASGFRLPIKIEMSPVDPNLAYVAEKGGTIKIVNVQTGQKLGTFLDTSNIVNDVQDRGLLDIAFHPNFAVNHYVYAFFIVDPPDTVGMTGNAGANGVGNRFAYVERFTADPSTNYMSVIPGSGTVIVGKNGQSLQDISGGGAIDSTNDFTIPSSETIVNPNRAGTVVIGGYKQDYIKDDSSSHAGGSLSFGPDGALYVTIGEGTSFNHADQRAVSVQDINSLSGKVLRVDPLTGQGLTDNPFYTPGMSLDANAAKVYELGLRNPFSSGWTPDGRLVVSDTGWNSYEEINIGRPGANFGWPFYEGADGGVSAKTPGYKDLPQATAFYQQVANGQVIITPAFRAFSHATADPGYQVQTITAGDVVYTGNKYPAIFQNDFFFTDFTDGELFTVDVNNRQQLTYLYHMPAGKEGPIDYKQGADGYIYYVDLVPGVIGRLLIADKPGGGNHAPVAVNDVVADTVNTPLVIAPATLLANDTDVDGDTLTLTAVSGATNGAVVLNAGQITFTPSTGFTGAASFQYTVSDGQANATGLVTVNVGAASTLPQLTISGNATKPAADTYQLTAALGNQLGGAMSAVRLDVRQNFSIGFDMNFGANDAGADGAGFVLHNDPRGAATVGWGGANLGLMSIVNGLAIAFDTYQNATRGDIVNDSASWADTDALTQTARVDLGNIEDGVARHIVVNWNAASQTLSYTLNGAAIASLTNAAFAQTYFGGSNFVYFGFTGATGGGFNTQSVKLTTIAGTFEGAVATNHPPVIAYNGGADTTLNILENQNLLLAHVTTTDADNDALTYALSGADAARFSISATGDLRFLAAPNFEAPADADVNNQYIVTVSAKDVAAAADTITFTINVADVAENAPIVGTAGADTNLLGTANSDIIQGLAGNDTVSGLSGNDVFLASLNDGNDTYIGGAGTDTLDMSAITVAATINLNTGAAASTQTGTDTLATIENAIGGSGADTITGTAAANRLSGGPGADTLTGGGGSDIFVFGLGFGADKITDFGDAAGNQDMVDFSAFHFADTAAVLSHVTQIGADAVIDLGGGDVLTLANFTAANFGVDDFFV